jgi:hypothetical protein
MSPRKTNRSQFTHDQHHDPHQNKQNEFNPNEDLLKIDEEGGYNCDTLIPSQVMKGITPTMRANKINKSWGEPMQQKAKNTCRIYFQNVCGISPIDDWSNYSDNLLEMEKKEVDIFGFAETNIAWTPQRINQATQHTRGRFGQCKIQTSPSDEPSVGSKQAEGTLMGVTGALVGRIKETGQDTHGLGRWSYVCLRGTDGKDTYIITAYRVSQDSNSSGDTTAHKQQVRLL